MGVLSYLSQRPGEIVSKEELLDSVWADTAVTDDALWRVISELRRVFGDDPAAPRIIETLARRGYRLIAPVEPGPAADGEDDEAAPLATGEGSGKPLRRRAWLMALALMMLLWVQEGAPRTAQAGPPGVLGDAVEGLRKAPVYWQTSGEARLEWDWTASGLDATRRGALHGVSSPLAYHQAGDAFLARGRVETAVIFYQQALVLDPGASELQERGQRFRERNELYVREVSPFLESIPLPESFPARLEVARKLRILKRTKDARWLLQRLLEERPGSFEAFRELTILDLTQWSLVEARERLASRLLLEPRSVALLTLAGELELLAGHRDAALGYFDRACVAQMETELEQALDPEGPGAEDRGHLLLCWGR